MSRVIFLTDQSGKSLPVPNLEVLQNKHMMRAGRLVNVFKCIYMYKLFCSMKNYYLNLEGFSRNLEDRGGGKSWAHINNNFSSPAKYLEAQQLLTLHMKYSKY
jgi:hypothetical protein